MQSLTVGINSHQVTLMVQQLREVEGPFTPGDDSEKQLVLEVSARQEPSMHVRITVYRKGVSMRLHLYAAWLLWLVRFLCWPA